MTLSVLVAPSNEANKLVAKHVDVLLQLPDP